MKNTGFVEMQGFRQPLLWLALIGLEGLLLYANYSQLVLNQPIGDHPVSNGTLLGFLFLFTFLLFLLWSVKLMTKIDETGIYYRFSIFQRKFKFQSWSEVKFCSVRTFSPLREYGGWGIRWGGKSGMAYTVSGNQGLQLVLKDQTQLLIGTKESDQLKNYLESIHQWKEAGQNPS
ncbi:MAG: hypothetical protein K1X82_03755 [Bacteroidia bacterium]|nr:hypothetical protein [Bacteroidia bacterium]